jgi:uncharacterized protein (TIGR03086 family)
MADGSAPDVVARYEKLARDFGSRVDAVPPDKWSAQSPCTEWTARDVVAHVIGVQQRTVNGAEDGAAELSPDEDPKAAYARSLQSVMTALRNPDVMKRTVDGPFGPMPMEQLVGRILSTDVLVHTWDLARAAGLDEQLDADAVGHAYEGVKPLDQAIRVPGVFGPKVTPPAGADQQTEFLCFLGRQV